MLFELQIANQSLSLGIPKGPFSFAKENGPFDSPHARCRENPALSGGFDSLCHIGTKINRPLWQR